MRMWVTIASMLGALLLGASAADAWHTAGRLVCDNGNGQFDQFDLPLGNVVVNVQNLGGTFSSAVVTDALGRFFITLPDTPDSYTQTLDGGLPADAVVLAPGPSFSFTTTDSTFEINQDYLISSATCQSRACWLTGGGVKFEPIIGTSMAEGGPKISFGGNVHPGCSPTAGQGGQWNHVDHKLKLHFQGTAIPTVACGNVAGIPPGSTSPVTPFNFIEFSGTGTLKGISGNKVDFGPVYFFARAEDRNEPGSNGAKDGALIDRYFLRVFTDPANPTGSTVYLFDIDGSSSTVDPVTISGGNLQIHISSCDNPPLGF